MSCWSGFVGCFASVIAYKSLIVSKITEAKSRASANLLQSAFVGGFHTTEELFMSLHALRNRNKVNLHNAIQSFCVFLLVIAL